MLTEMCEKNKASLANAYKRVVLDNGNEKARSIMSEVFEESDADWRGIGLIPLSGLRLKRGYNRFDAANRFGIDIQDERTENNCICGDILRGTKKPKDCPLFEKACTPDNPRGACMVSSEGCCAAWYKYGD
jgi:hydrogenase expression/formation protein HypD